MPTETYEAAVEVRGAVLDLCAAVRDAGSDLRLAIGGLTGEVREVRRAVRDVHAELIAIAELLAAHGRNPR